MDIVICLRELSTYHHTIKPHENNLYIFLYIYIYIIYLYTPATHIPQRATSTAMIGCFR